MYLQNYFRRIAYRGGTRPDLATLRGVLRAHVCAVPFENLDVQLGRPLTTDIAEAYDKIVNDRRGGWCYEQNGVFGWALAELGYDVTRVAAAVMRQDRGDAATANHLCLLASCPDSTRGYLVDVGFGGSLFGPIECVEGEYAHAPYRIGLTRLDDGHWRFRERLGDDEPFGFDFLPVPADEKLLAGKCSELQTDPSSSFALNLVAQLRGRDRHTSLRGRVLRIATPEGRASSVLPSAEALRTTLREIFRLDVPEVTDLWPRITARHESLFPEGADDTID